MNSLRLAGCILMLALPQMPLAAEGPATLEAIHDAYARSLEQARASGPTDGISIENYRSAITKASNAARSAGQVADALAYSDELKLLQNSSSVPKGEAALPAITSLRQRFHATAIQRSFQQEERLVGIREQHEVRLREYIKSALLQHRDQEAVEAQRMVDEVEAQIFKGMSPPSGFVPWSGSAIEVATEGAVSLGVPSKNMDGNHATYCLWVYPFKNGNDGRIIYDGNDVIGWERLIIWKDKKVTISLTNIGLANIVGRLAVPPDAWSHVALVISENDVCLYINGCLDTRKEHKVIKSQSVSRITLARGVHNGGLWEEQFRGRLTDVRVWKRVLSAREVRDCMMNRLTASPGLVGCWQFLNKSHDERDGKWTSRIYGKAPIVDLWKIAD